MRFPIHAAKSLHHLKLCRASFSPKAAITPFEEAVENYSSFLQEFKMNGINFETFRFIDSNIITPRIDPLTSILDVLAISYQILTTSWRHGTHGKILNKILLR